MAAMNLGGYKPKYGQDPALFNEMYMNYINQLQNDQSDVQSQGSGVSMPSTHSDMMVSERPQS